ncbi:MAG: radical SAM/SPASM domain-containing protein [Anaerolineae bacterium]
MTRTHISRPTVRGLLGWAFEDATQCARRMLQRAGVTAAPLRISIDVTDHCNLRCPTCDKGKMPSGQPELRAEQWDQVFRRISHLPLRREIALGGGEPLTRPDIVEIVASARCHGLRVALITNGWNADAQSLQRLEQAGLNSLMVSLNSLCPAVHDSSRAMTGSHRRIMELIEAWCAGTRRVRLSLSTVIMETNCRELAEMAAFARERGLQGIAFQALLPTETHYALSGGTTMAEPSPGWWRTDPLWVTSLDVLREQLERLATLKRSGYPILNAPWQLRQFVPYSIDPAASGRTPCLGTISRMYIDPLGDVRLCYGYPPVGNALRDDPRALWWGVQAGRIRQESLRCARPCRLQNSNQ